VKAAMKMKRSLENRLENNESQLKESGGVMKANQTIAKKMA
jgi:hypothetical protein